VDAVEGCGAGVKSGGGAGIGAGGGDAEGVSTAGRTGASARPADRVAGGAALTASGLCVARRSGA